MFALGGGGTASAGASLSSSAPIFDTGGRAIGWQVEQSSGGTSGLSAYAVCGVVNAMGTSGPPAQTLTVTSDYPANEDNEVSSTIPGTGQHTYTFQTNLTGTLTFATLNSGNVVKNVDGTFAFCDTNQDSKADGIAQANAFITAINGVAISASPIAINQPIPASGTMTVTVDSAVRNTRIRVVGWQDKNNNQQVDLTGPGDVNCDSPTSFSSSDGLIAVSGRKFWFGPQGGAGPQGGTGCPNGTAGLFVYRHDSANQVFSAGNTSATSLRYYYDSGDTFRILGAPVSLAVFKAELTASNAGQADVLDIVYDPNPAGTSTFNICINRGADAPTDLSAAVGNFDNGGSGDDVRLSYTTPAFNVSTTFNVQRASRDSLNNPITSPAQCTSGASPNPSGSAATPPSDGSAGNPPNSNFTTIGGTSTPGTAESGTFTNYDLANGGYCFRLATTDFNTNVTSYSNYVLVLVPGGSDTTPPASTSVVLILSGGFANTLDTGDKVEFDFVDTGCGTSCGMSIAPNATIRVTDSDCGPATNAGPSQCSGGNTNTVADIVCGANATCTASNFNNQINARLVVTMIGNPTVVSVGSVVGAQLPAVVTDSSGVTDLSGNAWNLLGSADRVFGPFVGQ
jgi:hypothetical protein